MQIFLLEGQTDRQTKDTFRGSTALYAAFPVDTVESVLTLLTWFTVLIVYTVDTVHTETDL